MKKYGFHRALSLLLAAVMIAAILPASVFGALAAEDNTHSFNSLTDVQLEGDDAMKDKAVILEGTKFDDGYFKIYGSVTQRYQDSKGGTYAVELAKNGTGGMEFTVTEGADVTISVASTGGSNTSAVALINVSDGSTVANNEGKTEVSGTGATRLTYTDLPAGTYRVISPESEHNRGCRLMSILVEEEGVSNSVRYSFSSLVDVSLEGDDAAKDKAQIPEGTTFANGFFKVVGKLTQRYQDSKGGVYAVELAKNGTGALEFTITGTADVTMTVSSTGGSNTSAIALINTADGSIMVNREGILEVSGTGATTISYSGLPAGTYQIVSPQSDLGRGTRLMTVDVEEFGAGSAPKPERKPWAQVAAPVITGVTDNAEGQMVVTVSAEIGYDGADELQVTMYDQGNVVLTKRILVEKGVHTVSFAPEHSGQYSFRAVILREGEQPKESAQTTGNFILPLKAPVLISNDSKGGGNVALEWTLVPEASYRVYCDGVLVTSTDQSFCVIDGLTIGQKYTFRVDAVRNDEAEASNQLEATVTAEEQRTWGFTYYGASTNGEKNGYAGSLNEDGFVTVFSEGGKGKIQPASTDGLAFYYTAVPTAYNFTLRAKVTVDSWTFSNGQEGFGLMVADRLGVSGDGSDFWNNQYMALASKIEYKYDADNMTATGTVNNVFSDVGTKYSMKLGLGTLAKTGVTRENLPMLEKNDTATINSQFRYEITTLETSAGFWELDAGTYNIIGNYSDGSSVVDVSADGLLTEFILEIQKNNTGYFITYYDSEGNVLAQQKYYGADSLNQLDADYVYAGFFASRNARATFSDVVFTTILASEDAPAEEKPITVIDPKVEITSPTVTTSQDYTVQVNTNVNGTLTVTVNNEILAEDVVITGGVRYSLDVTLGNWGENRIQVRFLPDGDQPLPPDSQLGSTDPTFATAVVVCNKGFYHRRTIYVSPTGLPNGTGSKEYPLDIYTAVNNAIAGQTIVLMEGTYLLNTTVRIQRGMDGTAEQPIRMIADPEAATRPVLDFQKLCAGIVHGGDYWYFYGFDVTNSANMQKGFQVSGNYNTLDQIHTYNNGNSGIQISRYSGTDLFPDWPAYNLILNCTSYCNADSGFEDADGFAAKLTVGEGNVFDGCIAYNNADDGWDLYAKVETGPIGSVTIRNCVAYNNGFLPGSEKHGNGNGFKLGGSSISGKHVLENSYAFFNWAKGIDSNSCPDVIVKNCVSYNNGNYNVALYTNNAPQTDFFATGVISIKDSTSPYPDSVTKGDNLKPRGMQELDTSQFIGPTNYYWDGQTSANANGKSIDLTMFVSLEFKGIVRNADGTIDMQGFLAVNDTAPADVGVKPGGMASAEDANQLPEDLPHNYSDVWVTTDIDIHWRECDCGDKTDIGPHELVWIIDQEPTPTSTGLKHRECTVCGYKKAAIVTYYEKPTPSEPSEPTQQPTQGTEPSGDPVQNAQGPDAGTIILIVVAVVVVLAGGGFLVFRFVIKKKK